MQRPLTKRATVQQPPVSRKQTASWRPRLGTGSAADALSSIVTSIPNPAMSVHRTGVALSQHPDPCSLYKPAGSALGSLQGGVHLLTIAHPPLHGPDCLYNSCRLSSTLLCCWEMSKPASYQWLVAASPFSLISCSRPLHLLGTRPLSFAAVNSQFQYGKLQVPHHCIKPNLSHRQSEFKRKQFYLC